MTSKSLLKRQIVRHYVKKIVMTSKILRDVKEIVITSKIRQKFRHDDIKNTS